MTDLPVSQPYRVTDLPTRKPLRFNWVPEAAALAALAPLVGAESLRNVRLEGEFRPAGRHDVLLEARLRATAVQPCVVTLAPVTTKIDAPVLRRYLAEMPEPEGDEVEMPEDDSIEPLPAVIDLADVLAEALALALPLYPRADGAELGAVGATAPGAKPLSDEKVRPFAGLGALRDRLAKPDGTD
ncbi:MAG: DUF177 domain-containing protein [Rhodobacteraceae bacterium]|nr:DUF177 domain-containing protein [Paracoccaceae bacterium]